MSGSLKLIVNADDFGISEAVNRGIVEAHVRGIEAWLRGRAAAQAGGSR